MSDIQMGAVESKFAEIIWSCEPISASELAKKADSSFKWKKTTTYTVLKRLCDKGIFKNEKGLVTSIISKENYYALQSEKIVDESFGGSLPAFFAAFTSRKNLTDKEIEQLRKLIDKYEGDK